MFIVSFIFHRPDGDLLECKIELQLKNKPTDVNALTSASYCYILDENFCLVKDLVVNRVKSSSEYQYIFFSVYLDMYAIRHIRIKVLEVWVEECRFE